MNEDKKEMSDTEQEWVRGKKYSYDPNRWDPEERPDKCQVCDSWLEGAGGRATVGQHCRECGVQVWIA